MQFKSYKVGLNRSSRPGIDSNFCIFALAKA